MRCMEYIMVFLFYFIARSTGGNWIYLKIQTTQYLIDILLLVVELSVHVHGVDNS